MACDVISCKETQNKGKCGNTSLANEELSIVGSYIAPVSVHLAVDVLNVTSCG